MIPIEHRHQQALQARNAAVWHYAEPPFTYNGAGGEITAFPCGCGCRPFETEAELQQHIDEQKARTE